MVEACMRAHVLSLPQQSHMPAASVAMSLCVMMSHSLPTFGTTAAKACTLLIGAILNVETKWFRAPR